MTSLIWVNPRVGFGSPCLRGTGLSTATLYGRWLSGETVEEIADDYSVPVKQIEAAVYYELGRRERNGGRDWREAVRP